MRISLFEGDIMIKVILITPIAAPRMTQSDKWRKRPVVLRYFAYKDELRLKAGDYKPQSGQHVTFFMPPPESWSAKKKLSCEGLPHLVKPDCDNLLKGFWDCLLDNDSYIWDVRISKRYSKIPRIEISDI